MLETQPQAAVLGKLWKLQCSVVSDKASCVTPCFIICPRHKEPNSHLFHQTHIKHKKIQQGRVSGNVKPRSSLSGREQKGFTASFKL